MPQLSIDRQIPAPASFEKEATEVMACLRKAMSDLIHQVDGGQLGIRGPADVRKAFGIDRSLGWQIFRIATSPQPVDSGVLVPGTAPMQRVLKTAREKGVPEETISAAANAYERFERLVERHAGDRSSFDAMIGVVGANDGEGLDRLAQRHKRAAFRANSYTWGVQSRAMVNLVLMTPNDVGSTEVCYVRGHVQLRQLRPDASIAFEGSSSYWETSHQQQDWQLARQVGREPLDHDSFAEHGVALLERFCSSPLPIVETSCPEPGVVRAILRPRAVGNTAAIDVVIGERMHVGVAPPGQGELYQSSVGLTTPTELLLSDLLVPKGRTLPSSLAVRVAGSRHVSAFDAAPDSLDRLPFNETARFLGDGTEALYTPLIPWYRDLGQYVFEQLGWDAESFDVYRTCIEFPPMFSKVFLSVEST